MRRYGFLIFFVLAIAASAHGAVIPEQEIMLQIFMDQEEVELGKAFPLKVVRLWHKDLAPQPWNDQALEPLKVRLIETLLRETGQHMEETRHYQCYAFSLEEVRIPSLVFKASPRGGGPERVALHNPITLRVKPALDPERPGPAELPSKPLLKPSPRFPWYGGGAALLVTSMLLLWYRQKRRHRYGKADVTLQIPPHVKALKRLERLKEQDPKTGMEIDAYHVEASCLIREYVEEQFHIAAPERTTEEFLMAHGVDEAIKETHRALLAKFLSRCDLVKFGRQSSTASDRADLLEAAAQFVEETLPQDSLDQGATSSPAGSKVP